MEKGYFAAAWGDVTKSPGWISKIIRLGLLFMVPIFGPIVIYGYLFGWARDIAWNVHRPMPDKIFGNEDGSLYKRGFFVLLIFFVFSLVPAAFNFLTWLVSGTTVAGGVMSRSSYAYAPVMGGMFLGMALSLVSLVLAFAVCFFDWVGAMRTALYGTLSAGFQLNKIWAMLRYDFTGLLRIFGMTLIMGLAVGLIALLAMLVIVLALSIALSAVSPTGSNSFAVAMVVVGILLLGVVFLLLFCSALCEAINVRALGYWARQFEVNRWGGQEDPMPFEQRQATQQYYAPQQLSGQVGAEAAPQQQAAPTASYQDDASSANTQQAQPDFREVRPSHPVSCDPSVSAPVQTVPYQAAQQPVAQAPFEGGQPAVAHKAASQGSETGEAPEASDGAPSSPAGSTAAASSTPALPDSSGDWHPKPDAPEQGGNR